MKSFQSRIESVQYNAALCITTRAHRGSSYEKSHQKRLMGRLGLLYKVLSTKQSAHVHELTHLFPMYPFSLPYGFLELEKGCTGNKWVNFTNLPNIQVHLKPH